MAGYNVRYSNGNARRKARAWVLATQDRCAICGGVVDKSLHPFKDEATGRWVHPPGAPEVDEIVPVSLGGSPIEHSNLQLTHRACNRAKSNKLYYYVDKDKAREKIQEEIFNDVKHSADW